MRAPHTGHRTDRRRLAPGALAVAVAVLLLAASCSSGDDDASTTTEVPRLPGAGEHVRLEPLHVADGLIVDASGRQVLLRGANVNALGEYHQADPAVAPNAPVTDEDWDLMAAHGLSVVRLLMSWSRLEPERGEIDGDYLNSVAEAVRAANQRGIYVVLDVHQDAWSMQSATPEGETCPQGLEPAIGWDGAPAWATITDGGTTCLEPGAQRESAPAVQEAFSHFYANTDGIADRLTAVWAAVAKRFAGEAGVAGYDLLNEPNAAPPFGENAMAYTQWLQRTIDAIRAAEEEAGKDPTPVFVEPLQLFPLPDNAIITGQLEDDDLVFAPHNYAESIGPKILTVEQTFQIDQDGADALGAALWIGEYGFWNTEPETLEVARRYAAEEDRRALGGAWWQWRQTCGDPHSVGKPGATATEDAVHLITRTCPGDTDAGPTTQFLLILGRAYPRTAPGRITELTSDPDRGTLSMKGTGAEEGGELVVWLPKIDGVDDPQPGTTEGLDDVTLVAVEGGRILTATTTGSDYALAVG